MEGNDPNANCRGPWTAGKGHAGRTFHLCGTRGFPKGSLHEAFDTTRSQNTSNAFVRVVFSSVRYEYGYSLAATSYLGKPVPHASLVGKRPVLTHLPLHPVLVVEAELRDRVSYGSADASDGVQDSVHGALTTNKWASRGRRVGVSKREGPEQGGRGTSEVSNTNTNTRHRC